MFDREFTKSLIIRDFDDVLKNPFRYVHLFILHTLLSKKNFQKSPCMTCNRGSKVASLWRKMAGLLQTSLRSDKLRLYVEACIRDIFMRHEVTVRLRG